MSFYTKEQMHLYFERIHYPTSQHPSDPLTFLTELLQHQLVWVPFETLALHYSTDRHISLDVQDLFEKIVVRGRGGYCLENNTFFSAILGSLGFEISCVVCRITYATRGIFDGSWRAMSHVANVVTCNDKRYLVDVGYGTDGPCYPLPLVSGEVRAGLPNQQLMLQHKRLQQHKHADQRVWVYSQRREPGKWVEIYHFPDAELFPADLDVFNHYAMTRSLWARAVVAQRFVFSNTNSNGAKQKSVCGTVLLYQDQLKSRIEPSDELVEKICNEEQRITSLRRHFGITLTDDERHAIRGFVSELN